jgi:SOS-response transcriptional repressor LexA
MTTITKLGLTAKQRECFDYIEAYWAETGISPSFEEIMDHMELNSKSGVSRLVTALVERGYLLSAYGRARSLIPRHLAVAEVDNTNTPLMRFVSVDEETMRLVAAASAHHGITSNDFVRHALAAALRDAQR